MTTFTLANLVSMLQETDFYRETVRHIKGIAQKIKETDDLRSDTDRRIDEHRIRLEALEEARSR